MFYIIKKDENWLFYADKVSGDWMSEGYIRDVLQTTPNDERFIWDDPNARCGDPDAFVVEVNKEVNENYLYDLVLPLELDENGNVVEK